MLLDFGADVAGVDLAASGKLHYHEMYWNTLEQSILVHSRSVSTT